MRKGEKGAPISLAVRVSEEANQLWEDTARHLGVSKSALLEIAIRKIARAELSATEGDKQP